MAHTKAAGSTRLGRDSKGKRLGVKKFGEMQVIVGNIIVRQRGTKFVPGTNTRLGKDYTIYASAAGKVKFQKKQLKSFNGKLGVKTIVHVVPLKPPADEAVK